MHIATTTTTITINTTDDDRLMTTTPPQFAPQLLYKYFTLYMIDSQHFLYFVQKFLVSLCYCCLLFTTWGYFSQTTTEIAARRHSYSLFFRCCCARVHVQLKFTNPIYHFPFALYVVHLLGMAFRIQVHLTG